MTVPGWWWPGFFLQLAIFLALTCGFAWWFMHWAQRHVGQMVEAALLEHDRVAHPEPPSEEQK